MCGSIIWFTLDSGSKIHIAADSTVGTVFKASAFIEYDLSIQRELRYDYPTRVA